MASNVEDKKLPTDDVPKRENRDPEVLNPEDMGEFSISRIITTLEMMDRSLERMTKRIETLEEKCSQQRFSMSTPSMSAMVAPGITIRTSGTGSLPPPHENLRQPALLISSTAEQQRGIQLAVNRLDRWSGELQEISWSQYKENFQRVCATLSEQTRLMVLDRILDSPAKSIFLCLLHHDRLTWEHLNIEFMKEFDGESRREAQLMIIFSEVWDPNCETLHQFAKRISNLVDQAFPPQHRDFLKIQQVIRAAHSYPIFQGRNEWIRELSWNTFLDVVKEGEKIFRSRQQAMLISSLRSERS